MGDIEELEYSLELSIGTKFYYWNRLYEVVKSDEGRQGCPKCALFDEYEICSVMNCDKRSQIDFKGRGGII